MRTITHPAFWECNCEGGRFVHPFYLDKCPVCGAECNDMEFPASLEDTQKFYSDDIIKETNKVWRDTHDM